MKCNCKSPVPVSHWFAEGQNHRANPGDLVCCACGGGVECSPEDYAKAERADRRYSKRIEAENRAAMKADKAAKLLKRLREAQQ